jgi:acyl-CoA thioester hydrolase
MTSESRVRVRYAETDQMGVVYYANYLVWFEVGRIEHMRQLGLTYRSMEEEGCGLPVVEAVVRYKAPARFDDELIIRTHIGFTQGSILSFDYAIHRAADDLLLCEGSTTHIVVDRAMKRTPMPARYAEAIRNAIPAPATK